MKESTFQSAAIGGAPPKFVRGNSANLFAKVKFKSYVCAVFYTAWRVRLVVAGIFYAPYIRFRTPVWSVNAPTAMLVEDNGKGETVFIFATQSKPAL